MLSQSQIAQARAVDLLALLSHHTTVRRVAATGQGEYAGACPFCGGHDRLRVQPHQGRWFCRRCSPRWADAIELQMRLTRTAFVDAVQALADGVVLHRRLSVPQTCKRSPPSPQWLKRAHYHLALGVHQLWQPEAQPVRAWLYARGLSASTLRHWRIGYWPTTRREPGSLWGLAANAVYLPAGIVIPGFTRTGLSYLKIRRFNQRAKYAHVLGGQCGLYLSQILTNAQTVIVCEGEFDALLLWQCLQAQTDLRSIAVVTAGSQAVRPRAEWLADFCQRRVLLAFDRDCAGQNGQADWLAALPHATLLTWPGTKDLTDYHQRGGSLAELARSAL